MVRALRLITLLLMSLAPLVGQERTPDDALRRAYEAWNVKWRAYTDAAVAARREGRVQKGGELPDDVQTKLDAADTARAALLEEFGGRDDLGAGSYALLAKVHERGRDYAAAVGAYEESLARGDPDAPDLGTLHALCIAALNSKDDALAARWMRRTIAVEDAAEPGRRNVAVRTSYYPRTLIALEDWEALDTLLGRLAADDDPRCRAAAQSFGVVRAIAKGDLEAAQRGVDAIRADPEAHPDHQAWAVLAQLALSVGRGEFDAGARVVRAYLAATEDGAPASAADRNRRRYLAAVEPFLGEPAPPIRVDEWVGGAVMDDDVLGSLRGDVVVLDFWQPWCEPCRKAMPHLVALQNAHQKNLAVIGLCKVEDHGYDVSERRAVRGIAEDEYVDHVADFDLDMDLNYILGIAHTAENNEAYAVAGIPTLVVIDRAGIVRYMSCGAGEPGLLRVAVEGVLGSTR